jgi:phosphate transport system protein
VKDAIAQAMAALVALDAQAGARVVAGDRTIDEERTRLERECLTLIALQQPLARDLRDIGAGLRILVDLERIADHASDIARVAVRLEGETLPKPLEDIPRMAEIAQGMVAAAVDAYVARDAAAAEGLTRADDDVDHLFSRVFGDLVALMQARPDAVRVAAHLLLVASHLERIADHATNLAESVIYAVTGERPELND